MSKWDEPQKADIGAGIKQCQFVISDDCDGGYVCCTWERGHSGNHQTSYGDQNGDRDQKKWHLRHEYLIRAGTLQEIRNVMMERVRDVFGHEDCEVIEEIFDAVLEELD